MKLKNKNGILYPGKMKFKSWIVTGTPGSGKSYLIEKIGGWPGELGIDITIDKWWTVGPLSYSPREIHFALPFKGIEQTRTVYDEQWENSDEFTEVDWERIKLPKKKKFILAPNWRARFVFDFILPPPQWIIKQRKQRHQTEDKREMDAKLSKKWIQWQAHILWETALYFHNSDLQVLVRPFNSARPFSFSVLKKIISKKGNISKKELSPDMNWSKVKNVRMWLVEAAPKNVIKQLGQKSGVKKK